MTDHPFTAEADLVKRALRLPNVIAADLSVFGGILRCGTCKAEQPLGDPGPYIRHGWPQCCGQTMTWVTQKQLLAEHRTVPDGYELVAVPDDRWQLVTGKRCRRAVTGRRACRAPSVAELNRKRNLAGKAYDSLWPYCLPHFFEYAWWIEQGQVWSWALREIGAPS